MNIKERLLKILIHMEDMNAKLLKRLFPIVKARIGGKIYTKCAFCPAVVIKRNIWEKVAGNLAIPTYQCGDYGGRFIYNHERIPGWCPYAIK